MKNVNKYLLMAVVALATTACVDDLNTEPIDKNSSTSFNQARMFTKCYATLALTGQEGPTGDQDVEDIDEGTSAFFRTIWYMNTIPTDEGWWIWTDDGVPQLRINAWDGENVLVKGIYGRLTMDIKYCNHFLAYAIGSDDETQKERAEVRFIRALNYYYLLDFFRNAPLSLEESTVYPHYVSRADLYNWLVGELKDLTELLPAKRLSMYRVDQAAAWLLLARVYLNSGVYLADDTATPVDTKPTEANMLAAKAAAEKALTYGYQLYTTPTSYEATGVTYTAYQKLFMGDNKNPNTTGPIATESPLIIYQDGAYSRSYGGSFLTAAMRISGMVAWGASDQWSCFRSSPTLVYNFTRPAGYVDQDVSTKIKANEYEMPKVLKDDRAILCSFVKAQSKGGKDLVWKVEGKRSKGNAENFMDCWAAPKFTNVYSTVDRPEKSVGSDKAWPDFDLPMMRIAEAHLIKAEAMYRLGDAPGALAEINNTIRQRANAEPLTKLDDETLLAEWCREFWGEGRRRTDLIRFDHFFGPQSDQYKYNWEGRMDKDDGSSSFKSGTEVFWNWFPVPSDDKKVNPNYAADVEANSPFEGGDGYVYGK
ncbi:MAG: RagB/SusD family nutrient uptake outer membrane protein [Bacteroidales bacterium]|nr:RagB/SusD family nutrient uptake outer membrane protein [Candidatus Colicola equi]